jgi:pimeloyl-ACP methyl ester carboxylesterase
MHSPSTLIRLREDAGQGTPLVLLVAAGASSSPTTVLLAHDHRVLTFEVGQGATSHAAQELAQAIAHVTTDPVGVIAPSSLSQVALSLALAAPNAVNAVALLEPDAIDRSLAGKLSGVTIPVLAMFGIRGEASPPPLGKVYKQAMPNCHLTYVYAADAGMDRQRPEAVAAALGEFMQTRERYLVTTKSSRLYP